MKKGDTRKPVSVASWKSRAKERTLRGKGNVGRTKYPPSYLVG